MENLRTHTHKKARNESLNKQSEMKGRKPHPEPKTETNSTQLKSRRVAAALSQKQTEPKKIKRKKLSRSVSTPRFAYYVNISKLIKIHTMKARERGLRRGR